LSRSFSRGLVDVPVRSSWQYFAWMYNTF
jgi:hypothetical protein